MWPLRSWTPDRRRPRFPPWSHTCDAGGQRSSPGRCRPSPIVRRPSLRLRVRAGPTLLTSLSCPGTW
ncbi:hypothetical protein AMK68_04505 [candidate division KD3-62 bacterium DG_56]|uniref:Uncharacterized protein n=1 Tax=candidate division KD3-62 bacterium DG_56 TaxID=1704032 RepID=A0A0S7XJX5_9BACT|nr:MAG: hypothetical protein AMK68_04505 [candidate division KD3-62 bacterium DG_56]